MPVYKLLNPSDDYTFLAPNIEVAGVAVALLSTQYGAEDVATGESTPVLFGWSGWLAEHSITDVWVIEHVAELAAALDSFLIGDAADRAEVDSALALMPDAAARQKWLDERHGRRRSSMNNIGVVAKLTAERLRMKYPSPHQKDSNAKKTQAG